jgi:hypothetical protein
LTSANAAGLALDTADLDDGERAVLRDALDEIQLQSKLWLLDELERVTSLQDTTLAVLGGWCGVLPWLLHRTRGVNYRLAVSVDIDAHACSIGARTTGRDTPRLYFVCQDVCELGYERLAVDHQLVLVNTICEHLADFDRWRRRLPGGTLVVLQSNNYRLCPDHVNCVDSAEQLAEDAGLRSVHFTGERPLSLFTRYMVIGRS